MRARGFLSGTIRTRTPNGSINQSSYTLFSLPGCSKGGDHFWLNCTTRQYRDPVVCLYDLTKLSAGVIIDVLRNHPLVIIGGTLQENPFFVPPDEFLRELRKRKAESQSAHA